MMSDLLKLIGQIVELEHEEVALITKSFSSKILAKGEFFLQSEDVNEHVAYLAKGLVRYFVYKDEEESTFEFTKEGEFIADYQSFNHKTPSKQNIQAIEDCELLIIDHADLQNIFHTTKHGNLIGRVIIEHRFDIMVNQLLAIYMQSHEERYRNFVRHYSDIAQRIPQYLIASYVGVKAPSLSRIRRRFAKGIS
ncbi:MAG: Crp/Fnr family transcriptional regulator [Flavobacteriales bacterium]|nr:Crp/Fnr family transcriptional regulator [Flavobacteriales bacterium]